jgi:hypothetical protein
MKPRNREINIFNMSLLDVLCGALGAFCFMMLVLFPFYSQDKGMSKAPDVPAGIDPKNFEQAQARIRELEATLKQFQDYAAQLEAKMKQMGAQSGQAQAEADDLRKKNRQLETRNPIVVVASFLTQDGNDIELYEEDNCGSAPDKRPPKVDPTRLQGPFWTGDKSTHGPGLSFFVTRDAPPCEFRFFLKILKHNTTNPPMSGFVAVQTADKLEVSDTIYNTREKVAIPIAVVSVAADLTQSVKMIVPKDVTAPPEQPNPDKKRGK